MTGTARDVEVIQVVRTRLWLRGGTPVEQARGEVARRITQYWSLDGELLAEVDPFPRPNTLPDPTPATEVKP